MRSFEDASPEQARARTAVILLVFAVVAAVVAVRLVQVTAFPSEKASSDTSQTIVETARRGTIYDRNGVVLATDVKATTVYCNPREVSDPEGESKAIASVLGGDDGDYVSALTTPDTSFAYIKRKADVDQAQQIEDMDLDGLYFEEDTKRVYPCGQNAGQIVGMCDIDDNGLTGLELYYNDILSGQNGEANVQLGTDGRTVVGSRKEVAQKKDGQDIVLSIDIELQQYLEDRLSQETDRLNGKSGNAVLYDGATGEIVAIASTPYLNPSDRSNVEEGSTSLKSITTAFEPGSIFKGVSMTAVMESGVLTPDSTLFCPQYLQADDFAISDEKERSDQTMTMSHVMAISSNVGMSLAAQKLGFDNLYSAIVRYKLTEATGVDYPGESSGYLTSPDNWSLVQAYNVSFGQGVMVTPLQMCRFYGALADGGVEQTPHFLVSTPDSDEQPSYDSEQVIDNQDAIDEMTGMLEGVVSGGTGTGAQIDGFTPAGKTGTGQYIDDSGKYTTDMSNISFIGYLPNTNSKLVCFVGVTEVPGDAVTTPAFKDIMSEAIKHYGITAQ